MYSRIIAWVLVGSWALAVDLRAKWSCIQRSAQQVWSFTRRRSARFVSQCDRQLKALDHWLEDYSRVVDLMGVILSLIAILITVLGR
jgi:hypothetical protein